MYSLSVAEQQIVQIAAAVAEGARVIVFDEPSSSLGESEARALYALIGSLKARGVTLLYVSHRMPEIFALCDAITVLRDGQHVMTCASRDLDEAQLVQHMIGRTLEQRSPAHWHVARGAELLRVEHFSSPGKFRSVSFSVHAGEVLGLAGLVGAGRSEIAQALFGLDPRVTGDVYVRGQRVRIRGERAAQGAAILVISSELPELIKVSSRVLVLRDGQCTGEVSRNDATQERLLRLMAGL